MITISPEAREKLLDFLRRTPDAVGVKIFLTTKGCGGNKYDFEKVNDVPTKCDSYKINDSKYWIFVDLKASLFLFGSELIYKKEKFFEGFDFINPQEKGRCGCGESIIL
jgi:iron-sulfur cluster assembly protein